MRALETDILCFEIILFRGVDCAVDGDRFTYVYQIRFSKCRNEKGTSKYRPIKTRVI